ncbi:MAG: GH116 family glycosyl-hydrolase, partial [Gemmatimonadota bacterium]
GEGYQVFKESFRPGVDRLPLTGVEVASAVHYWGHYPVADLEFETTSPIVVGLRAWCPFLPGDLKASTTPAIVFDVHARNSGSAARRTTLSVSFPGPLPEEAGAEALTRRPVEAEGFRGVEVSGPLAAYCLGVVGEEGVRLGGELGADGGRWAAAARSLPEAAEGDAGAAVAADFTLASGETRIVRFVLSWCAPTWNAGGHNWAGATHTFTHMYARWHPSAAATAAAVARDSADLLQRVLAWQQEVYSDYHLPVWLRDSLVNNLHLLAECSFWASKADPLPAWVREEDGLFGLSECPRGCPQIECLPCSFYGNQPLVYFFPELALSTLRGYQGYQYEDGTPPWVFGGCTGGTPPADFANPTRGYQWTSNGVSIAAMVDRYVSRLADPGERAAAVAELYPMVKRCMTWTLGLRTTPSYSPGERIVSMPDPERREGLGPPREWFEADAPGFFGMTAHVGGLHLAQLRLTEKLARLAGDEAFAGQCAEWARAGAQAMEERLWTGSYYLNCLDPATGERSDLIFGYQLDGEWVIAHHGLAGALLPERVRTTLETLRRSNVAATQYGGAVCYTNADGSPRDQAQPGVWDYGTYASFQPPDLMLAMTYMYFDQPELGLRLAERVWHNVVCRQGCGWQMPNGTRGDADTGEGRMGNQYSDYYQNMMLWSVPAAAAGQDFAGPCQPGGLVDRILQAAARQEP